MGRQRAMQRLAKWHIWLGWVVGLPMLMWTVTGLIMVAKPIEEVRGTTLMKDVPETPLAANTDIAVNLGKATRPVRAVTTQVERGEVVTRITYMDGTADRFRADGSQMAPLSEIEARMIAAERVAGGDRIASSTRFDAGKAPFDFRKPEPVWQVVLKDGTRVYVGAETGEIAAVRTGWWRFYDFMWGLHIMDPVTREDTHHPLLIGFAIFSTVGALIGCILLLRRRKARVEVPQ